MDVIRVIRIAFEVLSGRAMAILAMIMAFSLACWTMYDPDYIRAGMAAFFALAVYIPAQSREGKSSNAHETQGS